MSIRIRNVMLLLLAICVIFLCAAGSAESAQEGLSSPDFDMEVSVGYDGLMTYGKVMPVKVTIRNFGNDLEGTLGLNAYVSRKEYDRYEMEVAVPAGSQREFTLYVSVYTRQDSFTAELVQDGKVICTGTGKQKTVVNPSAMLVGVLSTRPQSLNNLNIDRDNDTLARYEQWKTIPLTAETFPEERRALASFGMLVIDDIDPAALSRKQQEAMDEWLKGGGILLCGGGSNAGRNIPYFSTYTGMTLEGMTTSDSVIDGLEKLLGRRADGKKISVSLAEYSGQPLARDAEDHGLIYRTAVGRGRIYTAAFEMGEPRLNSENLMHFFWQQLLAEQDKDVYSSAMYSGSDEPSAGTVMAGYSVTVPAGSRLVTGLIIVAGVLVICCVCWWILKKKDLRQWMWAVIPLVSLAAAVGILFLSAGAETNRPVAVVAENIVQDNSGVITSYVGINAAAPSYGRHSYSMDGYELKARMYDYVDYDEDEDNERRQPDRLRMSYTAGGESAVTVESVYAWDSIALETERDPGIHGKIEGEAWMADDGLHAEIINGTDVNMADGFLITSYGTAAVKALAPGEKADVILEQKARTTSDLVEMGKLYRNSLNIYDFITAASAYRPEGVQLSDEEKQERSLLYEMVSNAIDAVRQAQGNGSYRSYESAVFMYCAKPAGIQAPGLKADGVRVERKRDVSLLTASIPFSAVGRTGMVFRSPGMDRPVPVSTDENLMPIEGAFEDDSKQDSYYILSNNPTFLYTLEGMEGAKLSSLRVVLDAWYSEQARVFVLNVEKHAWEEIRLNEDVRNPERYLDEKGRLYVQFRTDSMDMYSDIPTPMISLEGRLENAEN